GPIFEGHFPGRPILPGVAALAMIASRLAEGRPLTGVRAVRFRDLVPPGATLDLDAADRDDGSVRFDAHAEGRVLLNGRLAYGASKPLVPARFAVAARPPRDVPPFDRLLLHRGPARLVRAIAGEAEDGATCIARIPAGSGLAAGGTAPALAV